MTKNSFTLCFENKAHSLIFPTLPKEQDIYTSENCYWPTKTLPEPFMPRIYCFNMGWYKRHGTIEGNEIIEAFVSPLAVPLQTAYAWWSNLIDLPCKIGRPYFNQTLLSEEKKKLCNFKRKEQIMSWQSLLVKFWRSQSLRLV
jgi:hypothetical protein